MNYFITLEEFLLLDTVTYYTVQIRSVGSEHIEVETEFNRFLQKFESSEAEILEEFQTIINLINKIGEVGAKEHYFRNEDLADALPSSLRMASDIEIEIVRDSTLRLYCKRISDNIVILFNGDVKTNRSPKLCDNVKAHFRNANTISNKLLEELENNSILNQNKKLHHIDGELCFYI